MDTQHTLKAAHRPWQPDPGEWTVGIAGADGAKYVFIPGLAKPINAGTPQRGRRIVQCVNNFDALMDAVRAARTAFASIANGIPATEGYAHKCALAMDDAITTAKAGAPT